MLQWDTLSERALGNLVLSLTPPVYQTVEQMNAPDAWDELQCIYGAIFTLPSIRVFQEDYPL